MPSRNTIDDATSIGALISRTTTTIDKRDSCASFRLRPFRSRTLLSTYTNRADALLARRPNSLERDGRTSSATIVALW